MAFALLYTSLLFLAGLAILVKSADFLVFIAEKLAKKFRISPFIVGVTLLALGTSLPELSTALMSAWLGMDTVVVANALGANVTNLLLSIGVLAIINKGIKTKWNMMKTDLPLLFCSVVLLGIVIWDFQVTFSEALFLLLGGVAYVYYLSNESKRGFLSLKKKLKSTKIELLAFDLLLMIASVFGIYIGTKLTIFSIKRLTQLLNLSDYSLVSSTLLSIGTTLPEVIVSYEALRNKKVDLALGNIIGSVIFNTYLVIGLPALFVGSLSVSPIMVRVGLPFLVLGCVSFLVIALDNEVKISEGFMLLILYAIYLLKIFA